MTRDQFERFLRDSGVVFSVRDESEPNVIDFVSRGSAIRAIAYDEGDLLHLICVYRMPPDVPDRETMQAIFQDLEDRYPVVKLAFVEGEDGPGFSVAAEQFEPDVAHVDRVFWRTVDLLVAVADDGYRRLAASAEPPTPPAGENDDGVWLAQIEELIRRGSGTVTTSLDPHAPSGVNARIKLSIALLVRPDEGTGSAFCIASDERASYYATNAHVVRGYERLPLFRQRPHFEKLEAAVVALGDDATDLAILRVDRPGIPTLVLRSQTPEGECGVALAGYARVHLLAAERFGELVPSIRHGTITGIIKGGACILHDVLCRPGDSGAPLFDPLTGDVVGIQTGGWTDEEEGYAIGAGALTTLLQATGASAADLQDAV